MISPAFEALLKKSFKECLSASVSASLESQDTIGIRENIDAERIDAEQAIVLTISSHLFRVLIVLYFRFDGTFSDYLNSSLGELGEIGDSKTYDFLYELSNLYCGKMKRELQNSVPSLGMSTPNVLKKQALEHVRALKLDQEHHIEIKYKDESLLFASYFLSAYGNLDVEQIDQTDDVDAGELEFF